MYLKWGQILLCMTDPVYEPQEDSRLLQRVVPNYAKGAVLDMCTGSGILAAEAAKTADRVIGLDSNPASVLYAQQHHAHPHLIFLESDLFSLFKLGKISADKFDLIICNPPYLPKDLYPDPALDGGKEGYEFIARFLAEAKHYLKPGGRILLLFSSLTKKNMVLALFQRFKYDYKLVASQKLDFEELYVYELR